MIDSHVLKQINHIVEHDATSSTYKYMLLHSTIDACQKYDHLIIKRDGKAHIPIGLIVEQWILEYMPFVFTKTRQQNFGVVFDKPIETLYWSIFDELNLDSDASWQYAYSQFRQCYEELELSSPTYVLFKRLAQSIAKKIVEMPMNYIGQNYHTLFIPEHQSFGRLIPKNRQYSRETMIEYYGRFSIPEPFYDIFKYMGQNLYGTSTILQKWKEKTAAYNNNESNEYCNIIDRFFGETVNESETSTIRSFLSGPQECVWSGKELKRHYDIDHLLPFSLWRCNDLWNLLPCDTQINRNQKRDKVPSPALIKKREECIVHYWKVYEAKWGKLFSDQIRLALTGYSSSKERLYSEGIKALCSKAEYLIDVRGHQSFEL